MSNHLIFKVLVVVLFTLSLLFIGSKYFLSYKIQAEMDQLAQYNYNSFINKDLHTLCMLDYIINPNGKDMLQKCKKIEVKQVKIDTPYLDFYLKYIYNN